MSSPGMIWANFVIEGMGDPDKKLELIWSEKSPKTLEVKLGNESITVTPESIREACRFMRALLGKNKRKVKK